MRHMLSNAFVSSGQSLASHNLDPERLSASNILIKIESPDNEHVSQRSRCSAWENGTLWRVFGSHKGGTGSSLIETSGTK